MTDNFDERRKQLLEWLQIAFALELATIPPYMIALLSIKLPANRAAAELIRSVMIEEMLHLALVANVMNAVGGTPLLDSTVIPKYPLEMNFKGEAFADRRFPVNLERFSKSAIVTFMKIEQPAPPPKRGNLLSLSLDVPGLTIGEFYGKIRDLLTELNKGDPGKLFTGEPSRQIDPDYYWSGGGEIIVVTDLQSALAALDIVISQGEGAWPKPKTPEATGFGETFDMGHYFRFSEIYYGRRYKRDDDPTKPPTGDHLDVDFDASYPIATNATAALYQAGSQLARLNESFNRTYTEMLMQLAEAVNGTPKALYTAIMNGMHSLTPIAHEMMKTPLDGDAGHTGCPTFEWMT
ncbi:ferritin-like domain-containing protein [Bradyrhizobium oligotrophicum]|uniref:ferritin-like domain-containing protein n=1 Tax=Bradyrhizobium oligotrophicum TaxID=44255 RepID=UPI003EBDCB9F